MHLSGAAKGAGNSVRRAGGSSAASEADVWGLLYAWSSPLITGKPAGKKGVHNRMQDFSCIGSGILRVWGCQSPTTSVFFLRARTSGGFSISGSLFPLKLTYGWP